MSRRPRELADPVHPYHRAPRGVWLLVGAPTGRPYPCRCHGPCGARCPCRGRTDHLDQMPTVCCARRAAETQARRLGEREEPDD